MINTGDSDTRKSVFENISTYMPMNIMYFDLVISRNEFVRPLPIIWLAFYRSNLGFFDVPIFGQWEILTKTSQQPSHGAPGLKHPSILFGQTTCTTTKDSYVSLWTGALSRGAWCQLSYPKSRHEARVDHDACDFVFGGQMHRGCRSNALTVEDSLIRFHAPPTLHD